MEASTSVAPYARLCQAAHLLGRVCAHVNRHASTGDADLHFQEASQLSRALLALLSMLYEETAQLDNAHRHSLFGAQALVYTALSTLYDVHSCVEGDELECIGSSRGMRLDLQQQAIDGVKQLLTSVSGFAADIERFLMDNNPAKVPPFVLNCLYTIAGTFAWYFRENGSEAHLASLGYLKRVIALLEPQWAVAGKRNRLSDRKPHWRTSQIIQVTVFCRVRLAKALHVSRCLRLLIIAHVSMNLITDSSDNSSGYYLRILEGQEYTNDGGCAQ